MIVTCVHVYVKKANVDDFIKATIENHQNSIREAGNMRFDVLQVKDESGQFLLYEAYESEEAVSNHKKTDHYMKWRDTVADWMEKPRQGIAHNVIAPTERSKW